MRLDGCRFSLSWRHLAVTVIIALVVGCAWTIAVAGETGDDAVDLGKLRLEELMNVEIEVASVSKKAQKLSDTTAAVYVITREDIRRSGATSIPELLRMAPGLHVSQIDANNWLIASRGLSDRIANKLLVLVDGRSVYSPMFSGVWWDAQDLVLEDIDRIEIIRGPGATAWGANAVNGPINIITKNAKETQEGLAMQSTGSYEQSNSSFRTAGTMSQSGHYRLYAKHFERGNSADGIGGQAFDAWQQTRTGFRADHNPPNGSLLTVQGQVYDGKGNQTLLIPILDPPYTTYGRDSFSISGANLLTRVDRQLSDSSSMSLQMYYDRTERRDMRFHETGNTWDIDFQHRFEYRQKHDIVWGIGYRSISDHLHSDNMFSIDPTYRQTHLLSAFAEDDIELSGDKLRLTVGSKFENNSFTGIEVQPSIRMLWKPQENHTAWGAISRAVRTPCRFEADSSVLIGTLPGTPETGGLPQEIVMVGNRDFDFEKLTAYELGYRMSPSTRFSLDVATYYHDYSDLRMLHRDTPYAQLTPPVCIVVPFSWVNLAEAQVYGVELASNWQVRHSWRLALTFAWQKMKMVTDPTAGDPYTQNADISMRRHQASLRSYVDLPHNMEFDTMLYHVDQVWPPITCRPTSVATLGWDGILRATMRSVWLSRMLSFGAPGGISAHCLSETDKAILGAC